MRLRTGSGLGSDTLPRRYRLPFARLCVTQSIWQLSFEVDPPLLHADTWSASISSSFQTLALFGPGPTAHKGQLDAPVVAAEVVCSA